MQSDNSSKPILGGLSEKIQIYYSGLTQFQLSVM